MEHTKNKYQDKEITEIKKHIYIINSELGSVKIDVAIVKTIVNEHKWLIRAIFVGIISLIFKAFV